MPFRNKLLKPISMIIQFHEVERTVQGPEYYSFRFSSVQFNHSVVSNSLRPHEPQHTRPPCPLPTPEVHPNPCSLSRWCHPTISSFVVPFSSCLQSFPASVFSNESVLRIRWPKYWSFSISPSNEYSGLISSRIDWFDLLAVQGTAKRSLLQHHSSQPTQITTLPSCVSFSLG